MAQFPGLSLTAQGNKMILRASTGKVADRLIVTKAIIGDGQLNTSIEGLTRLVSAKLEIGLSQVKELANGRMQLQFNFDNKKVDTGFYWREVGLYAKSGDSGEEKLIGYSNAKGLTSYIPDKTNALPMQRLVIALGVGDNPNVKGSVDLTSAITLEQLEEAINQHNTDANAHDKRFAKYLPLAGGTVTGDIKLNNAAVAFNNGNNTYDAKIRVASNGNFDVGVTEDSANKNATNQLLLHSQNRPKWYNSADGGKQLAIVDDIDAAKNSLIAAMNKYLPLAGGTVTGDIKLNNAAVAFNNGNNTYDAKIRVASNGNFDVGVTEDSANKNATNQLLLHSQNRPKWYNSADGGKQLAIVDDIDAAKNSLIATMNNYLPLTGGTVTGAINFINGSFKGQISLKPNGNLDLGSLETKCSVLNSRERPLWYTGDARGGMLALTRDIVPDPTQCVNLYDAKSEGYYDGRPQGTINLKLPYTDYDYLIIVLSADSGQFMGVSQINVSWLEKTRKMSVGTGLEIINIATVGNFYWGINNKSTPTNMITNSGYENSHIWEIWGYKITR